jgi:PAS domain S-box-containing protein
VQSELRIITDEDSANLKLVEPGNIRNITEWNRSIELLHESEEKYRVLSEYSPGIIFIVDLNGYVTYMNKTGAVLFNSEPSEIIGKHVTDIFPLDIANQNLAQIQIIIDTKNTSYFEKEMVYPTGKLWVGYRMSPLFNKNNEVTSVYGIALDITEKKEMISQLIEAKEKAESASKLKDAFIANMSHEIRTPLNGILGLASLIRDIFPGNIKPEDEELFDAIDYSSKRIIRTIDMILNYSRLQVGEYSTFPKKFELSSICIKLVKEFSLQAHNKSLTLGFQNNCGTVEMLADEYSIILAISNLIDNAIKYTKKGSIQVILYREKNDDILIDITDTGIGIDKENLDSIFEPYHQEQMGYGRAYEGVGLGLSLVKKVLGLNNAKISVISKKGEGSTFSINFGNLLNKAEKIEKPDRANFSSPEVETIKNVTVLIVEDDKINQLTIKKFLEQYYTTIMTESSDEVLNILKKKTVDIILMDISIWGDMNGLELTKLLKESKEYSHIPIIAVTAHAFEDDKQDALEAGCDNFLAKPFSQKALLGMINNYSILLKSINPRSASV